MGQSPVDTALCSAQLPKGKYNSDGGGWESQRQTETFN